MKAARLEEGKLLIGDYPVPTPGLEEALVRISAAGVCHSDLHLARGDWFGAPLSGGIGHEAIGIVTALGPGADRFAQVGDRVILGLGGTGGGYWCGACEYCLSGQPRHCKESKGILGTFCEYFPVYARSLVKIPEGLGDHEAPLACGGLTAYGAVKKLSKHHVLPGRKVAVIGAAAGSGTTRSRSRRPSATTSSASTSAPSGSPSSSRSAQRAPWRRRRRSRWCRGSTAESTPRWSSRRGWRASGWASIS
jgi:D-arabinose 1-dehydrogenase-like Zn-dependent alcohol dehydrogenase